jgi:hypothetical protein
MRPEWVGSSEKDSKARPPRGDLWILIVGASRQTAFRAFVSAASRAPASWTREDENVAPIQVALGRADAGAMDGLA